MEILYLLIPVSVLLVLVILGIFGWALHNGQLDDLEHEGERILAVQDEQLDTSQLSKLASPQQSRVLN
jgi:cbb3-type cytochrome oxidase maturation protein